MTMANIWCALDTMQIQDQTDSDAYRCAICCNKFTSPIQLTVHCIVVHRLLPCMQCLKLFGTEHLLHEHMHQQHDQRTFTCPDCPDSMFTIEKDLRFHMTRHHFKTRCVLCTSAILYDDFKSHLQASHKISNAVMAVAAASAATSEDLVLFEFDDSYIDDRKQFHCHLCQDKKCLNHLEKLILHFLYFHKLSLPSVLRCILADGRIDLDQLGDVNGNGAEDAVSHANKCTVCGSTYSWLIPHLFHQIYCHGSFYCVNCQNCYENKEAYDDHVESRCCHSNEMPAIKFCDGDDDGDCNYQNVIHPKIVDGFSANCDFSKTECRLMNSRNDCNFCGKHLGNVLGLDSLIKHFRLMHKFSAATILKCLSKRSDEMPKLEEGETRIKRSLEDSSFEESILIEQVLDDASIEYRMDFATSVIRYVYSSESDFDSLNSDDEHVQTTQPRSTTFERIYRCDVCGQRSKSKYVHVMHMGQKHGFQFKTPEFRCNICAKYFASAGYLKRHNQKNHHKRTANEGKRFKCAFCEFRCNGKSKMRQHIGEHVEAAYHPCQSKVLGFNCKFCHMIFWTREKLNDHQLSRHSENVSDTYLLCGLCFAAFNNLPTLRIHISTRHFHQQQQCSGFKPVFQCNICRIALISTEDVRMHMEATHSEMQSMFCAKVNCGQVVENEEQLKIHSENAHSTYTYQCLKCFKRFQNEHFIENHLQNAHNQKIFKTEMIKTQSND